MGVLDCCKNVIAATYQIYNISDDKPKFVIKKLSDISTSGMLDASDNVVRVEASEYEGHF